MKISQIKEKMTLHPIMTFVILILITIVLSGVLSLLEVEATYNTFNAATGQYSSTVESVFNLFSLSGLKYIFSNTVSNFVSFTPLSMLIIVLIGIGIMEKSGFLRTIFAFLTRKLKKYVVTFILVLISILASIGGDLWYIVLIPLSALLFLHGRRNPTIGIIATFAGLTCGSGLSILLSSVDSSLLSGTILGAHILDTGYTLGALCMVFIMIVAVFAIAYLITVITEKHIVNLLPKYEFKDPEVPVSFNKKEKRGLAFALIAGAIYIIIFIYNIIPGLPFSGNLLDYSQTYYIDKLFSLDSFFSNGFVFIITMLFVIWGLFYGLGAKTIRNNKDFCTDLGHSLDGIGSTLILILFASAFISIFKKSNIGMVVIAAVANIISASSFTGIPLILLMFILCALVTVLVPTSVTKWSILAAVAVPAFMNAGMSPEFTQVVFRFSECVTMGLTPLLAYFVIYLAFIEKYNQDTKPINLFKTIKYQLPYALTTGAVLIFILILWYVIGLPIGIGGTITI